MKNAKTVVGVNICIGTFEKNNLNRGIKVAFICDSLRDRNKA